MYKISALKKALSFSEIRSKIPIHPSETKRFLSIAALMFCILFNQNLVRALKDSIVITMVGAETTSFLKFWGVLPAAMLVTVIYVKLCNITSSDKIFYGTLAFFISFFACFAFILFPMHKTIHLSEAKTQALVNAFPYFKWFIMLGANWAFSLFYIVAELWPNVMLGLLFWQFVNAITSVEQSRRFYTLFGLIAQTGLWISGELLISIPNIIKFINSRFRFDDSLSLMIIIIMSFAIFFSISSIVIFWYITNRILDSTQKNTIVIKSKKYKLPLKDSLKMIFSSKYIRLIATLLICYGIAINLAEAPWKAKVKELYPGTEDYTTFTGQYLRYTGIFTLVFVLIGSGLVRYLGWFSAAIITPIIVFVTGFVFFYTANFPKSATLIFGGIFLLDPLTLSVMAGAVQNVFSKSSKYTLFDSTKEMAYVPLSDELKTKGKAAADVVGTKIGKASSAALLQIMLSFPSATYDSISHYLMVVFTFACFLWIITVFQLDKEYKNRTLCPNC